MMKHFNKFTAKQDEKSIYYSLSPKIRVATLVKWPNVSMFCWIF